MSDFGLDERTLCLMRDVFAKHSKLREVRVFGSRAKGNYRRESDVDLAIWGEVDAVFASSLASELDDLPLPYRFDVQAYTCIKHAPLREHIDRVGRTLFVRASSAPGAPVELQPDTQTPPSSPASATSRSSR